jgi:L-rhamnose-H+ transport protein
MRDRNQQAGAKDSGHFGLGLFMAITSGVCASMMNVGFAYGSPLSSAAAAHHGNALWLTDAIWVPLMAGGAIPNILYCIYLLSRRNTARNYSGSSSRRNVALSFGMAVLWFGSSVLYGIATAFLGDLGPVVGWPLFMSLIVIVASLLGVWTGEWKTAGSRALRVQGLAVLVLVCAVVVLSRATF